MSGIAVMFRSSLTCCRGAVCGADRTDTSASFIESGAYLKEFPKILSTSDARTISSTFETRKRTERAALSACTAISSRMKKTARWLQIN